MENPSQSYCLLDRLALVLGLGVVAFFCYQLLLWVPDRVMEVDTQGYFYLAQDLANLELPDRPDDLLRYRYHIYVDLPGDRVVAKYTPGFPLLLALGYTLGGTYGPFWVGPILSMGGVLMFWVLARALHGNLAALACAVCWLGAPMMLTYSDYPLAHGSNIALVIGTFYFCLCWIRTGKQGFALATGFLAGFLPMVRGTNVLFYGPLVLMLYFSKRIHADARPLRPHLTGALVAAAVPLAFFMVYNTLLFGTPWTTGYAFTREQNGFAWADFFLRLPTFFEQRGILFSDPVWIAAIFGLERGFRKQPALAGVLLAWFLPVVYVYGCYYWFGDRMGGLITAFFWRPCPAWSLAWGFFFLIFPERSGGTWFCLWVWSIL